MQTVLGVAACYGNIEPAVESSRTKTRMPRIVFGSTGLELTIHPGHLEMNGEAFPDEVLEDKLIPLSAERLKNIPGQPRSRNSLLQANGKL